MSKAVLIMDMPDSCKDCTIMFKDEYSNYCPCVRGCEYGDVYDNIRNNSKPNWCPLKPLPEKYIMNIPHDKDYDGEYEYGWNACIDEILSLEG